MIKKIIFAFFCIFGFFLSHVYAYKYTYYNDTISLTSPLLDKIEQDTIVINSDTLNVDTLSKPEYLFMVAEKVDSINSWLVDSITFKQRLDSLVALPISRTDTLLYNANPLFLPLVFMGQDIYEVWDGKVHYRDIVPERRNMQLSEISIKEMSSEQIVAKIRADARTYLVNNALDLFAYNFSELPDAKLFEYKPIKGAELNPVDVTNTKPDINSQRIEIEKAKPLYWIKRANALLQFSQNYQTPNWHKGGNSNLAFLSNFIAELNYDNLKNVIWENKIEWRAGFHSVDGDTLRRVSVNDDILRYITKFGVKAAGNWYYSISGEVSTQVFDNFKGINSTEYKARLFTPVRGNLGIGMNYKYKTIFSLMIAPFSFKYIYANDTIQVNPNLFGIEKGENQLKQFGSRLDAQFKYSPATNWDINSRLTVYTNYKKVEIDWEIVNNFIINRFLTARLLLNPRYDNTLILKKGEKARIQFKEFMSIGFSFRFL